MTYKEFQHHAFAHSTAITGLASDMVNRRLVSGSSDGHIRFWNVNPPTLLARLKVSAGVSHFKLDRNNNLLAVGLDGGHMAIVDVLSYKVARKLDDAHMNSKISALEFSPDGKWLISADDDGFIKVTIASGYRSGYRFF